MLRPLLIPLLALAAACSTVTKAIGTPYTDAETSKACFERIKSLAGDWSGQGTGGAESFPVEVNYRVTGGGSAVEETLFRGTPHEMITMYHLDGDRLMLTHYCAAGNQPRMIATDSSTSGDATTIRFGFAGATNLASPSDGHMHDAEMTIEGKDKIRTRWTYYENEKPNHDARFELTRKTADA
jgi:hypothetical protein